MRNFTANCSSRAEHCSPSVVLTVLIGSRRAAGADGQLCRSGSKAYSYTMPVSTDAAAIKGPMALGGSCPKGATLGGSCKFSCKDARSKERVMTTESRLVTAPPQDWTKVRKNAHGLSLYRGALWGLSPL